MHIIQDKQKEKIAILDNRVDVYRRLEINLRKLVTELETKVRGYYNSSVKDKELFNQQAINQTVGIGCDYNETVGKLSINSSNKVSVVERGIPHVLKGVSKPLFKKSVGEPLNEAYIIIQQEIRTEDIVNANAMSNQCVPEITVKVVPTTRD